MPNVKPSSRVAQRDVQELVQRAFGTPGFDSIPVRQQPGQVTYAARGFSWTRLVTSGDDEAYPSPTHTTPHGTDPLFFDARAFASVRFYLDFLDADDAPVSMDNASVATVEIYARNDNNDLVLVGTHADVGHREETHEGNVLGREVTFRLSSITLAGTATQVRVHAAGEGLGYKE